MRWILAVSLLAIAFPAGVMLWNADWHPDRSSRACTCYPDCDCGPAGGCVCGE